VIFNTQLNAGIVTVHWSYDRDDTGIYNTGVDAVIYQGIDVKDVLEDETLEALDTEGNFRFMEQFND
jgi:uncharacterized SAM-binding protein YcdF (DUF218 family)